MKRTQKQVNNIKNGCLSRDNDAIINAQKKRHLINKINKQIIQAIKNEKTLTIVEHGSTNSKQFKQTLH